MSFPLSNHSVYTPSINPGLDGVESSDSNNYSDTGEYERPLFESDHWGLHTYQSPSPTLGMQTFPTTNFELQLTEFLNDMTFFQAPGSAIGNVAASSVGLLREAEIPQQCSPTFHTRFTSLSQGFNGNGDILDSANFAQAHQYEMASAAFDFLMQPNAAGAYTLDQNVLVHGSQGYWNTSSPEEGLSSEFSPTSTSTIQTVDTLEYESSPASESSSPPTQNMSPTSINIANRGISRSFSCGIDGCVRAYHRKFELYRHQKTHSGRKEHGCTFSTCNRSGRNGFTRKDHLKQHLRQVHKVAA